MRKYIYSTICFVVFAVPSVFLILNLYKGPDPDGFLTNFVVQFIQLEILEIFAFNGGDIATPVFQLIAQLNIVLLMLTYVYIIILDIISDIIKISIHWLVKSGIFVGLVIVINFYFLNSTAYEGAQFFSATGVVTLTVYTTIYYLVMFHLILIVKNWLNNKHVQR
jgi:hypothetical protein